MKKPSLNKEVKRDLLAKPKRGKKAAVAMPSPLADITVDALEKDSVKESERKEAAKRNFVNGACNLLGFVMGLVTVLYILSLFSYNKADVAFSHITTKTEVSNFIGFLGAWTSDIALNMFGYSAWWLAAVGMAITARLFGFGKPDDALTRVIHAIGLICLMAGSCALEALRFHTFTAMLPGAAGGVLGQLLLVDTVWFLGAVGMTLVALFLLLVGLQWFFDFNWISLAEKIGLILRRHYQSRDKEREIEEDLKEGEAVRAERMSQIQQTVDLTDNKKSPIEQLAQKIHIGKQAQVTPGSAATQDKQMSLIAPPKSGEARLQFSLLEQPQDTGPSIDQESLAMMSSLIESKLATYGVNVKVMAAHPGPVVTRYEIELEEGQKANAVKNLESDLARVLSVQSIRILDTVPNTSYMGIEAPNPHRQVVKLSELLGSSDFENSRAHLPICLGKRITGEPYVVDLAKMPHLLVAGTTGSGKSVGVNSMILSLLYKFDPSQLRLIMIDPKSVEFAYYEDIPHLLCPVVTDMREANHGLQWCVKEMDRRYKLAQMLKTRSVQGFNQRVREYKAQGKTMLSEVANGVTVDAPLEELPSIVVVVDELADLLMVDKRGVEESLIRLAQKARAASIHLILATQRPSADVISGLLRTNIPSRAAFQVATASDSRIILDMGGAESLLGYGDFLFKTPGQQSLERVQGAFVSDEELDKVTKQLRECAKPQYIEDVLAGDEPEGDEGGEGAGRESSGKLDALFDRAVQIITESNKCSVTYLQRRLGIGYPRAANLVDELEREGIVSEADHAGRRQILVRRDEE